MLFRSMMDGGAGASSGASQAMMADTWNRQLHEEESAALKELMKGKSPEKKKKLREAAVAISQGDKGVSDKDPHKAQLVEMAARGREHTEELEELRATGLFKTTILNQISDFTLRNGEEIQLALGIVDKVADIVESTAIVLGSVATGNPWGVLLGGTLVAHSMLEGPEALRPYQSTEGQLVLDALDLDTFPGERKRLQELGVDLLTSLAPIKGTLIKLPRMLISPEKFFSIISGLPTLPKARKIKGFTPKQLLDAGKVTDSSDKLGQFTRAGRALRRSREGTVFPSPKGTPAEVNQQAQEIMEQIINNPHKRVTSYQHGRHGKIMHIQTPDGRGIRFGADGKFIGFLGPRKKD